METIDELQALLGEIAADGARGQLLDRGAAWAQFRQDGVLPDDAPPLGDEIETDLAEYGFSLLRVAMSLRERTGSTNETRRAFDRAARSFEAITTNGMLDAPEIGFYRVLAAASYHLASYSAIAYSLLRSLGDANLNSAEQALALLVLRDLTALREFTREYLLSDDHEDDTITELLEDDEEEPDEAISIILNATVCRALAYFDFALQTGDEGLVQRASSLLATGQNLAANAAAVSLWWIIRLTRSFIDDLWEHSLHRRLPLIPPVGAEESYAALRERLISSLYARKMSEVELWPSQLEAAQRSTNVDDDLVVALPTSAGKTRIAEICALMTLSQGRRVLIVTPLRALSAQTERSFRNTFGPLGFSVSSLYGASGVSESDEDALRSKNIVISTPEKLDFALRNDADIIDDVGLIVLDEGHMIGPTEREIRYETLVQRLLRRADASTRRIICLSAILPEGDQLNDLTAWIRNDQPGGPVVFPWRPTRQRFGHLVWRAATRLKPAGAQLYFDSRTEVPFISRFVEEVPARRPERRSRPREEKDLSVFAAWRFAEQGKKTLIFITQANWVEGYGRSALELVQRGYLPSLLDDPDAIGRAVEVGKEWLGDDHCAVKCLEIGVAIHHGGLPNPFLRELELLLSRGTIKVTVASPTLSQGLNLNAAVMLVPILHRSGNIITGEEFANVAGRAGRAFVDVEGLVVHVMHVGGEWRLQEWRNLVASARSRTLESGLIQIVNAILTKFSEQGILNRADAFEFLANSREPWNAQSPLVEGDESEPLSELVEKLDATVFGLIEALDANNADLPRLLDEALQGSLWARQLSRRERGDQIREWHRWILQARAQLIWRATTALARRGHFAMGVGLEAGIALDAMADQLNLLLDQADDGSLTGNQEQLVAALVSLAEHLLVLRPFVPDAKNALPSNWRDLLRWWVTGVDVNAIGTDNMGVVEDAFTYRLVWAMEALRTRRLSLGWEPDAIAGGGAASLETGVPQYMTAMLIRAGLPSRRAAIAAVNTGEAFFVDLGGMKEWLESDEVAALTENDNWPTPGTAAIWQRFRRETLRAGASTAEISEVRLELDEFEERPANGLYRVELEDTGDAWVCTPDFQKVAKLRLHGRDRLQGLMSASFVSGSDTAIVRRFGRGQARWSE
ncbi:DEAD/DEAH box helicase [Bradyrhizobium canariense]|uniref:DEAD/DEAH box helicase n=1 Tax=Bradyrhizobium canariense TaxID=255045 RepID=UPI001CA4E619|nr:DEAD/DEAH box helicase [Bradyrhizobium canariense]MBW5440358.1 DEAD/DEAH box helicase [Bradyrhizobium canariense]